MVSEPDAAQDDGLSAEDRADIEAAERAFADIEPEEASRQDASLTGAFPDVKQRGSAPILDRQLVEPPRKRRNPLAVLAKAAAVLLLVSASGAIAALATGVAEPALVYGREHYPQETAKLEEGIATMSSLIDDIVADIVDAPSSETQPETPQPETPPAPAETALSTPAASGGNPVAGDVAPTQLEQALPRRKPVCRATRPNLLRQKLLQLRPRQHLPQPNLRTEIRTVRAPGAGCRTC